MTTNHITLQREQIWALSTLYSVTGDIKDINTLLLPRSLLAAHPPEPATQVQASEGGAPCPRCAGKGWIMVGAGLGAGADECPVCIGGEGHRDAWRFGITLPQEHHALVAVLCQPRGRERKARKIMCSPTWLLLDTEGTRSAMQKAGVL